MLSLDRQFMWYAMICFFLCFFLLFLYIFVKISEISNSKRRKNKSQRGFVPIRSAVSLDEDGSILITAVE